MTKAPRTRRSAILAASALLVVGMALGAGATGLGLKYYLENFFRKSPFPVLELVLRGMAWDASISQQEIDQLRLEITQLYDDSRIESIAVPSVLDQELIEIFDRFSAQQPLPVRHRLMKGVVQFLAVKRTMLIRRCIERLALEGAQLTHFDTALARHYSTASSNSSDIDEIPLKVLVLAKAEISDVLSEGQKTLFDDFLREAVADSEKAAR
jgi:hypothetical protein